MLSFLLVLVVVCISSEPYFFRWLIGTIENKEGIYQLGVVVGIWSLFAVCTIVFRYMYGMRLLHAAVHDWGDFLMNVMSKMQSLPIEYHRNIQAGEKQKIVDRSAEAVWAVADNYILAVLPQVLVFITLLVSGLYIDPVFTGICLAFLPVGIYGVFYLGRTAHTNQRTANTAWDKMFDRLIDGIINLPVIRIFARTGTEYSLMKEYMQIGNAAQYKVRKNWSQFNAFGRFFTIIAKMITISAGGYMIYTGRTDYATFFFFIAFTDRIYSPIMEIFNVVQSTTKDIAYYEKAKDMFGMESEVDTGKHILGNIHTGISFRDMSFSYPPNTREVLSHISLDIQK
jgi:ATP-binding cassette subfamily B protein